MAVRRAVARPRVATFTEFVDALGVRLEPGQRAMARVAFDGALASPSMSHCLPPV